MRYTLTFWENHYDQLTTHLFQSEGRPERAAYLLCGLAENERETRLIVREVIPVADVDLLEQSTRHLSIPASSFLPIMKRADRERACFVFVHSHPEGVPDHSEQDDREERALFRTAYNRIDVIPAVHASVVFSNPGLPRG